MRKLVAFCLLMLVVLNVCMHAQAEPRGIAEQCPLCAHDTNYSPRFEDIYWITEAHEDHSDMVEVKYYVYYYSCTNPECGYSWASDECYWTRKVLACPDVG